MILKVRLILKNKFNIKVLCNYGLTETSSIASTESNIKKKYKYGSVGKPLVNNKIKKKKKKYEKFGEILIKGNNIFKEYLDDKHKTKMIKKKIGYIPAILDTLIKRVFYSLKIEWII